MRIYNKQGIHYQTKLSRPNKFSPNSVSLKISILYFYIGKACRFNIGQKRDVCGSSVEKNLAEYHFDHAFLGADSVSVEFGIIHYCGT